VRWIKGHGTGNDFLVLPAAPALTDELVRALCDRHFGIGADGVLRVVPAADDPAGVAMAGDAKWFMDYRNADGSIAEMCGNGIRVYARYLVDADLAAPGEIPIATRAGVRTVWVPEPGEVTVDMGAPAFLEPAPTVAGRPSVAVSMGNPHVVVALPDGGLAGLDLTRPPEVAPPLPGGQNVEFTVRTGPRAIGLRVHERGVGETLSCGTGVCAAVAATIHTVGTGRGEPWTVDVPGGRLTVVWTDAGPVHLTGPAVLVADGETRPDWS
jgi:diaminopimelate epimerase